MKRNWLIDYKGLATKVKNAGLSSAYQIKDCGANRECPKCHYLIDNSDDFEFPIDVVRLFHEHNVSQEWPGFPAGVKFDPSDIELLEHLAAKCRLGSSESHMFIQEFIPTLEQQEGICYTHPENLPGAKKDGSSFHFFHRTMNAYATGRRKRRKVHNQHSSTNEEVRWHKTGKTKPVIENGVQKGCKKILVLYTTSKKGSKPCKSNWTMHQYHLGTDVDEIEGRFVVSKIFYQPQKQTDHTDSSYGIEESDMGTIQTSPRTPKTHTPEPPRQGKSVWWCDAIDDYLPLSSAQDAAEFVKETLSPPPSSAPPLKDNKMETYTWLAGESQAADGDGLDHDSLACNKILDPDYSRLHNGINWSGHSEVPKKLHDGPLDDLSRLANNNVSIGDRNLPCGIADLENLEFDTPCDSQQLAELYFGSQDSNWLDHF